MNEIWKDIKSYEGYYQISNFGKVRSVGRYVNSSKGRRFVSTKEILPFDNGKGYLLVCLRKYGKRKNYYVHRLVAQHFLNNWDDCLVVDHIDYNRKNNSVTNLRVITQLDNIRHSSVNMHKPHKSWNGNKEKYIYKRGNLYRVAIKGVCDKRFATFDEAVTYKMEVLNERFA